jgi:hypothetical protein
MQAYHESLDRTQDEAEERERGFTQIPNRILRDPSVSMQGRFTYSLLLSYGWQDGFTYVGLKRLSGDAGVSERSIRGYVRELVKAGWLRVKRRGLNKTNVYYFNLQPSTSGSERKHTSDQERKHTSDQERKHTSDNEYAENKDTFNKDSVVAFSGPREDSAVPPSGPREEQSSRATTTDKGKGKSSSRGRGKAATTTSGEGRSVRSEKKAGKVAVDVLERALREAGHGDDPLTPEERGKFGGQVKCNQDFEDELPAIVACVVAAWPHQRLDAAAAYEEVLRQGLRESTLDLTELDAEEMDAWKRGGLDELGDAWARRISARLDADDVASATPRAGIEALRAYEHPSFGYNDLGAYAGLAGRWDFTGEDDPPWQITKEMGGTPDDKRTMFKRLRSVTRRAVREAAESKEVG